MHSGLILLALFGYILRKAWTTFVDFMSEFYSDMLQSRVQWHQPGTNRFSLPDVHGALLW
jgi:hypothetical protein